MKKIIFISTLLLLALCSFSKPVVTYSYTGNVIQFLFGSYATVRNTTTWEWQGGVYQCVTCHVNCFGDGPESCEAVYKTAINPNPFTEPEQDLILQLKLHVKLQILSGVMKGDHSETITIQVANNATETYVYTIFWDEKPNGEGTIKITNKLIN